MSYGSEQKRQIDRVLDYIETNLNEPLPIEKLAKISTYSPYHFQRVFKEIIGENVAGYIKRHRLENAAHLLIYEWTIPVTEVAFKCGFSSLAYFTYSFSEYFKASPKQWREGAYLARFPREYENSTKSKLNSNNLIEIKEDHQYNEFRWLDLSKVKVIELPACRTVNQYSIGPYTKGIPIIWNELFRWSHSRGLINESTLLFGVPRNNPYITPPEKNRYDCRIEISDERILEEYNEISYYFQGGKHVMYEFEEPVSYSERGRLIECYSELYSLWLPRSGYKYLGNPVELIQIKPVENSLEVECKIKAICLAIEPK